MVRFCPLFSGSKGNCTYIGSNGKGLLVDIGNSTKSVEAALLDQGVDPSNLCALLITHEHGDHIASIKSFLRKYPVPVILSEGTAQTLARSGKLPENAETLCIDRAPITVEGFKICRFATLHDCFGSSGYRITTPEGKRVAVCTDLGVVTDTVRAALLGCDLVMLEANHDVTMLQQGSYPYVLKQRILSESGHLSNTACACELPELLKGGTTRIVLAHLSQENNRPELARRAAVAALLDKGYTEGKDYLLYVAPPRNGAPIIL